MHASKNVFLPFCRIFFSWHPLSGIRRGSSTNGNPFYLCTSEIEVRDLSQVKTKFVSFCCRVCCLSQKTLWPACVRACVPALPHNDTLFRGSANIDGGGRHKVGQHYNRNNERRLRSKISRQGVIYQLLQNTEKVIGLPLRQNEREGLGQKCWIQRWSSGRVVLDGRGDKQTTSITKEKINSLIYIYVFQGKM